ncbi:MAG: hypothetical protein K6G69_08490 [Lachnospiraceae bacterium]|nr:hypothetical protein [Lachnospiraceae bacterium]
MRFLLCEKEFFKNKISYMLMIALVCLAFIIPIPVESSDENRRAGILAENEGIFYDDLKENLGDGLFEYIVYDSEDDINNDLYKGHIDYAFILSDAYGDNVKDTKRSVMFLSTPYSLYKEACKEDFFNAWLITYSDRFIENETKDIFAVYDDDIIGELKKRKEEYQNSDLLFDVNIVYDTVPERTLRHRADGFRSLTGLVMFMSVFIFFGHFYSGSHKAVCDKMTLKNRTLYQCSYMLSVALPIGILCLILNLLRGATDIPILISHMILVIAYSIIWVLAAYKLIKKESTFIGLAPMLLIAQLIVCPIIVDLGEYIKVFEYIRYIFPSGLNL